ncbi:MAG: pyrroline-5-carboxylate reductase [Pseudomonadota bacterium]|nr:pyrroline-5-carboxylate reductase [Pseudomonadota bacterium]
MRGTGLKRTNAILLVGAGRMGGALLKGWIAKGIAPIEVVEPHPSPALRELAKTAGVTLHADLSTAPARVRACVVALKPQLLRTEAVRLRGLAESGALMLSIAAGTSIKSMTKAWGRSARVVRAMPNTPGSIGRGIAALFAAPKATDKDRVLAQSLLSALGQTVWVTREALVDAATALSGSGPAYVFYLVEALAEAGVAVGLPREVAEALARATITGAGALLDADPRPAAELRRDVTSPGGTTEAALAVLMADDGLRTLMTRAVAAADVRAKELSS